MNLVEFFDPRNLDHMKAYKHLCDKGFWPEGFIKEGMEIPNGWQILIAAKMSDCWVEHMLKDRKKILDSVTFYDLLNDYRNCSRVFKDDYQRKFEAIKTFILENF